jgi:hypothetical protein
LIGDAQRYKELMERAADWWFRAGFGGENRGSFTVTMDKGGVCDIRELLADFALQLPFQQEAAMLPKPDAARLHEIARHLLSHDPYRRALDDHMRTCPGPPLLMFQTCPKCGAELHKL